MSFCVLGAGKKDELECPRKKERQGKAEVSGDRDCLASYSSDRRKPDKGTKEVKKMPECFRRGSATGTINSVLTLLLKRCAGEFFFARVRVLMNASKDCRPAAQRGKQGFFSLSSLIFGKRVLQGYVRNAVDGQVPNP
ncbi:hypothetical protein AVEN_223906-1 [Araneus ventricosus]|uniref:Uncharacterized protein n=1 Tax=Araneus ventricosus TaxID=182803 RepID=A0A4Y2J9V2_ARAVE|nr:hypothetical protein AVEN_223906-1 [Araneus ventricosus]